MTVSAVKILQPGEISGMPADDTPLLVVPQNAKLLFEDRARRLEQLAPAAEMPDWLRFCATLARAQAACVTAVEPLPIDEDAARESLRHGLPPLSITTWPAGAGWDAARQALIDALVGTGLQAHPGGALARWRGASAESSAALARDFLAANEHAVPPEFAPFIGATLQVIWTASAVRLEPLTSVYKGENALCPICGSHPVASAVRTGNRDSHRYLVCSLCASEWYAPRARCTNCDTPKEVSLLGLTRESAVQGECCDDCHGYIKLMVQSRDPQLEVVADDLGTITLDLALAREGYQRTGRNLFFTGGNDTSGDADRDSGNAAGNNGNISSGSDSGRGSDARRNQGH